jgi:hypothetical protein
MMDYRSLSHWLARPMSATLLATLTPAQRLERTRSQKKLSKQRKRAKPLFAYPAAPEPPRRDPHRDYLFDPKGRDILRP